MLVFTQLYSILKYNYGTFVKTKKLTLVHYYKLKYRLYFTCFKTDGLLLLQHSVQHTKLYSVTSYYEELTHSFCFVLSSVSFFSPSSEG